MPRTPYVYLPPIDVSSNVSTSSATERKLKLLEAQLESERSKRKELEELLKAQKAEGAK